MSGLVVPTFEENGIFMLGVVFFIQSIFTDPNNNFHQKFLFSIEDIDFLSSNAKKIFHLQLFFVKFWGLENCQNFYVPGLNYARFKEFIHNAESVTRIIYAWRIIPHKKIVPY